MINQKWCSLTCRRTKISNSILSVGALCWTEDSYGVKRSQIHTLSLSLLLTNTHTLSQNIYSTMHKKKVSSLLLAHTQPYTTPPLHPPQWGQTINVVQWIFRGLNILQLLFENKWDLVIFVRIWSAKNLNSNLDF